MEKQVTLKPELTPFVEALQNLIKVQDRIFNGLTGIYGEDGGEKLWYKSPVYNSLEDALREVKILIGDTLEMDFCGALGTLEKKEEEERV